MLSKAEALLFQDVRQNLRDLQIAARRAGTQTDNPVETFSYGLFSEACHTAEYALHEVLNTADSYLDAAHAAEVLREG